MKKCPEGRNGNHFYVVIARKTRWIVMNNAILAKSSILNLRQEADTRDLHAYICMSISFIADIPIIASLNPATKHKMAILHHLHNIFFKLYVSS